MTNKVRDIFILPLPVFYIIHMNGGTEQSTYVETENAKKQKTTSQPSEYVLSALCGMQYRSTFNRNLLNGIYILCACTM